MQFRTIQSTKLRWTVVGNHFQNVNKKFMCFSFPHLFLHIWLAGDHDPRMTGRLDPLLL